MRPALEDGEGRETTPSTEISSMDKKIADMRIVRMRILRSILIDAR
jgi:hypothetical protein